MLVESYFKVLDIPVFLDQIQNFLWGDEGGRKRERENYREENESLALSSLFFSVTEAAVLTAAVPFCGPLLVCALLNPLLLFKLSACNELKSFDSS